MDLIILALLEEPSFWNYVFPVNLLCGICLPIGAGLQILLLKNKKKWCLLPLILLILSVSCECLYQIDGTFDAFLFVLIGIPAYFALVGSLIYTLLYRFWTKVRH